MLFVIGCTMSHSSQVDTAPPEPPPTEVPDADTGFTLIRADHLHQKADLPPRLVYEMAVLHVLVPQPQRTDMDKIWNFLREDVLDAETQLRLRRNGLRVGVGHAQSWEPIKAAMDAIEGHKVAMTSPLRVPIGFPLALELDAEPHDQTLFYVGRDGILSGGTWPASRNVLRISYSPDPHQSDRVVLLAVPQVHQKRTGWEWIRTEAGLWQVPRQDMQSFDAAGFMLSLDPGEFVLIAPSENSALYGLLGGVFLTRETEGRHYDSYVFIRPEARQIGQND